MPAPGLSGLWRCLASELVRAPGPLSTHLSPLPPTPRCPALAVLSLTATLLLQNPPAGPWGRWGFSRGLDKGEGGTGTQP